MDANRIAELQKQVTQKRARKLEVSQTLLDGQRPDEEVKALLNESAQLGLEIEALEQQIRDLEFPYPEETINPWEKPAGLGDQDPAAGKPL